MVLREQIISRFSGMTPVFARLTDGKRVHIVSYGDSSVQALFPTRQPDVFRQKTVRFKRIASVFTQ